MRLAVILFLTCLGLGAVVAGEMGLVPLGSRGTPAVAPVALGADSAAPPLPALTAPPRRSFEPVVARNLFSPTRAPVIEAGPAPTEAPVAAAPRGMMLKGVVITPKGRSALIKTPRAKDYVAVREGEEIETWKVTRIDPDHVMLRTAAGEEIRLEVWDSTPERPVPAPRRSRPRRR